MRMNYITPVVYAEPISAVTTLLSSPSGGSGMGVGDHGEDQGGARSPRREVF